MMSRKLPEVCEIQYGFPFDSSLFSAEGDLPLIRIRDVVRGYTETYTSEKCDVAYLVHEGDILVGMDGVFNVAKWKGEPAYLNQRVCRIIPNETIDADFLFYFIPTALKKIENETAFVTVKHLKAKELNAVVVPDVPIEEQKKIAAQLNAITHLISLRQRQAEKLDELVKARFVEMFGDPVLNTKLFPQHELKEYIQFLTSGSRGWAKFFSDDGELFITIKNVKNGHINLSDIQHVMPPDNAEAKRTKVQAGDLLISITADLGRTGVVSDNLAQRGAYINQHLTCIRLKKDEVLPQYVSAFLESAAGKRQFSAKNQSAVKAGLNFEAIKSLRLFMPPLELQREYIAFVNEVDREKERIQRSAALLETLKRSLMQQYFG